MVSKTQSIVEATHPLPQEIPKEMTEDEQIIHAYQTSSSSIQDIARIRRVSVEHVLVLIGQTEMTSVDIQGDLVDASEIGPGAEFNYGKTVAVPYTVDQMYGRSKDLAELNKARNNPELNKFTRTLADKSHYKITQQLKDKKLMSLREQLIRAARARDQVAEDRIQKQMREYTQENKETGL